MKSEIVTPAGYHIPILPRQKPNKGDLRVCLENDIPTCYVYNGRKWILKKGKEHMKKYIDTEKLIAEIERRKDCYHERGCGCDNAIEEELDDLLVFIASLQQDQPNNMIQWTGNNLKEVIDFTGKSPRFGEWFNSWEEYENYVHTHNDILKLFCEDGSNYEVPVGAWIVKTPDGYNVPSVAKYIQQEQPIKVYRVENEKEQKGLWRKFDGTWEPLFDMLTDGQCKDMPMGDSPIYREGGKQWFASAPSKETLQKWFSKKDLEELTAKGFTISEFEVVGHKKVSDFEYIFTRDNIISRTYLEVSDIYPQDQPEGLHFTPLCRLIQKIPSEKWNDSTNNYAKKLRDCLIKEGYLKDASVLQGYISYMNGNNVPMAIMDEQEQPEVDLDEEIEKCLKQYNMLAMGKRDFTDIALHFYELGFNARKEESK